MNPRLNKSSTVGLGGSTEVRGAYNFEVDGMAYGSTAGIVAGMAAGSFAGIVAAMLSRFADSALARISHLSPVA